MLRSGRHVRSGSDDRQSRIARELRLNYSPVAVVPTDHVVFRPLDDLADERAVSLVVMLVNPDKLSAPVTLAGFRDGASESAVAPWGASCRPRRGGRCANASEPGDGDGGRHTRLVLRASR